MRTFSQHTESVSACAWLPGGPHFLSAGMDKRLLLWDLTGAVVQVWAGPRLHDLAVSHTADRLLAVSSEQTLLLVPIAADDRGLPRLDTEAAGTISESEVRDLAPISRADLAWRRRASFSSRPLITGLI